MMTREDLIRGAGEAEPELMQKTAAIIEALPPHRASQVVAEIAAIADYTKEKLAFGPLAVWGAAAAGSAASGVLNSIAGDLYDAAKRGLSKQRNFNAIMKANPDLKVHPQARREAAFDALHLYAPEMTADPLVGGGLLKNMIEGPAGNEAVVIKDMLMARKNLIEAKDKQWRPGVPIELPSNMDERREQRDIRSDRFQRRSKLVELGLKGRELKGKREEGAEKGREAIRARIERTRTETKVKPLVDLRLNQARANIDAIKMDKGLTSAQKQVRIATQFRMAEKDLAKIRRTP